MDLSNILESVAADQGRATVRSEVRPKIGSTADLASKAVPVHAIFTEAASREELQLVQRLFFLPDDKTPRVAVVCGVGGAGDRAELVGARVAEVLASQVRDKVCLVDANLKDPTLHRRYDLDDALHRVSDIASEQRAIVTATHRRLENLWILPGSILRQNCIGLSPDWVRAEFAGMRKQFGFLLICAPPLETALDGMLLGRVADGIVLVLDAPAVYRSDLLKIRRCLDSYRIRLLGTVVNRQQSTDHALGNVLEGARQALRSVRSGRSVRRGTDHQGAESDRAPDSGEEFKPLAFLRRLVF